MSAVLIVKVGGGAAIDLEAIAADLAACPDPFVVVLGANAERDRLAARLGLEKRVLTSLSGYSSVYSDAAAIDLIMMSYAGLRLGRFVEACQRRGVNALGLSGLDGALVRGRRNRGIRVREGGKTLIKRDFSGKPRAVDGALLGLLLERGYRPVLTIPIADEHGFAINSENDDIVVALRAALGRGPVVQLIEAPGLLERGDDPGSLIRRLDRARLAAMEARAEGRIRRKLLALTRLLEAGASEVVVADGRLEQPLTAALAGAGTRLG